MKKLLLSLALSLMTFTAYAQYNFGDLNRDGDVNITDVNLLVGFILQGSSPFSVDPTIVTIPVGGTSTVEITGDYNNYEVVSTNTDVAKATLNDKTITLNAISKGVSLVTVKEVQTMRYHDVIVVVEYGSLQVASDVLTLSLGDQGTVDVISGTGNYTVQSSNADVATAALNGNSIVVTTVSEGSAIIFLADTITNQTVNISVTVVAPQPSCPDKHHPHMIDLGLPSGTKWACCNVGANSPTNSGKYFSWGEIREKDYYYSGAYYYNVDVEGDICGTEYDAAFMNWGGSWQMPTTSDINELLSNCEFKNINGKMVVKGANGNKIFLPFSGYKNITSVYSDSYEGMFWSGTNCNSNKNDVLFINKYNSAKKSTFERYRGLPIRPVSKDVDVELLLSTSTVDLFVGDVVPVEIISGSGYYTISNNNERVATSTLQNNIVVISAYILGENTITITDRKSGRTANIEVKVLENPTIVPYLSCSDEHHPHLIDLGLPSGTKWACCNVGDIKPEGFGRYYAWGETEEKDVYDWSTYVHCDGEEGTCYDLGNDIAGTDYDVAHVKWGGVWQMPTYEQLKELSQNCTFSWTEINGVKGCRYISKENGSSIFLPAAGYFPNGNYNSNPFGQYWSSSLNLSNTNKAYYLYFNSYGLIGDSGDVRYRGRTVRPVSR